MEKLHFENLHKFKVSIGILLIALPCVLFGFVFNNNEILLLKNSDYIELTEMGQKVVEIKQNMMLQFFSGCLGGVFIIASVLFIGAGVFFVRAGFKHWMPYQEDLDSKTRLEKEKLEKEIGMSEQDLMNKADKEVKEDMKVLGVEYSESSALSYFEVEKLVAQSLAIKLSNSHQVIHGARIGNCEYDVLAKSKAFLEKDYLFEIKYWQKPAQNLSLGWMTILLEGMNRLKDNYQNKANRIPKMFLIIVTNKFEIIPPEIIELYNENEVKLILTTKQTLDDIHLE